MLIIVLIVLVLMKSFKIYKKIYVGFTEAEFFEFANMNLNFWEHFDACSHKKIKCGRKSGLSEQIILLG